MIRRISGTAVDVTINTVTVDVGGVGYYIYVPNTSSITENAPVTLFTHLAVRENALDLYGFLHKKELEMFELLLGIQKVGPKSALQIMSQADIALLEKAALTNDPTYLSKMSGIGKKTAEKIVVELKDKLDIDALDLIPGEHGDGDVIDALMALGYSQREARDAVAKLPENTVDTDARIKAALQQLGK
jgi:Holliday junction DNA helicase RuvA